MTQTYAAPKPGWPCREAARSAASASLTARLPPHSFGTCCIEYHSNEFILYFQILLYQEIFSNIDDCCNVLDLKKDSLSITLKIILKYSTLIELCGWVLVFHVAPKNLSLFYLSGDTFKIFIRQTNPILLTFSWTIIFRGSYFIPCTEIHWFTDHFSISCVKKISTY